MKGLIPWLREVLCGSKVGFTAPRCVVCHALWDIRCASGYCWQHHYGACCVRNFLTGEIVYTCRASSQEQELEELRKMIQTKEVN